MNSNITTEVEANESDDEFFQVLCNQIASNPLDELRDDPEQQQQSPTTNVEQATGTQYTTVATTTSHSNKRRSVIRRKKLTVSSTDHRLLFLPNLINFCNEGNIEKFDETYQNSSTQDIIYTEQYTHYVPSLALYIELRGLEALRSYYEKVFIGFPDLTMSLQGQRLYGRDFGTSYIVAKVIADGTYTQWIRVQTAPELGNPLHHPKIHSKINKYYSYQQMCNNNTTTNTNTTNNNTNTSTASSSSSSSSSSSQQQPATSQLQQQAKDEEQPSVAHLLPSPQPVAAGESSSSSFSVSDNRINSNSNSSSSNSKVAVPKIGGVTDHSGYDWEKQELAGYIHSKLNNHSSLRPEDIQQSVHARAVDDRIKITNAPSQIIVDGRRKIPLRLYIESTVILYCNIKEKLSKVEILKKLDSKKFTEYAGIENIEELMKQEDGEIDATEEEKKVVESKVVESKVKVSK